MSTAYGSYLDRLGGFNAAMRENYGNDESKKPNDHCVWQRELPTASSGMAWIETDEHFRQRIKENLESKKGEQQ